MIPKSLVTFEGVWAAAPMTLFAALNSDGSLNWAETRGVLTFYCNKTQKGVNGNADRQFTDMYEVRISGEQLLKTVACHVYKGKGLARVTCFMSMPQKDNAGNKRRVAIKCDKQGNPDKNKNTGGHLYIDVPTFYVQSIELGDDSEAYERERAEAALEAAKLQGTLPPNVDVKVVMNTIMSSRRNKAKSTPWNYAEAKQKGTWGHAKIWSEGTGNWMPNAQAQVQQPAVAGADPELLKQFLEFQRMQAAMMAQTTGQEAPKPVEQTASAEEAVSAPGPEPTHHEEVGEAQMGHTSAEGLPDNGNYDEIPF